MSILLQNRMEVHYEADQQNKMVVVDEHYIKILLWNKMVEDEDYLKNNLIYK